MSEVFEVESECGAFGGAFGGVGVVGLVGFGVGDGGEEVVEAVVDGVGVVGVGVVGEHPFAGGSEVERGELVEGFGAALGVRVEASEGVDFVAEEFDASGEEVGGRPDVDDAAADGEAGGFDDGACAFVAAVGESAEEFVEGDAVADGDLGGAECGGGVGA